MYHIVAGRWPGISHVKKSVVEDIFKKLTAKFGQDSPLTMSRGKVLEYLGIKIDYGRKGRVTLSVEDYIKKLLENTLWYGGQRKDASSMSSL